jgi:EpsI family protein
VNWLKRILLLGLLGFAAWRVYDVRGRLSREDADPAAVERLRTSIESLPLVVDGRYHGQRQPVDEEIVRQSGADSYVSIAYRDGEGNRFRLYVGGCVRNQENFHAPSYCMPASGWESLEENTVPFEAFPVRSKAPRMRRLLLQKGTQKMVVYYWFQAGDRLADHEWSVRWFRFLDLLADEPLRPTVIVTLYATVSDGFRQTERAAADFLGTIGPHLRSALLSGE